MLCPGFCGQGKAFFGRSHLNKGPSSALRVES